MAKIRTAFLSSTGADLAAYRKAAHAAINTLDDWKCVWMEDFGARDWNVDSFCHSKVLECDLFIGIIGHRFGGSPPRSKRSYTQREYYAAQKAGKPRLLFMAPDDFPVPANLIETPEKIAAQRKFREALRRSGERLPAIPFQDPGQLALQITQAIYHWAKEQTGLSVPTRPRSEEDPARYLKWLHGETGYIDVRGFQLGQKEAYRFPIDQLYTPLTTMLAVQEAKPGRSAKAARHGETMERKPVPLQDALRHARLVIVGDPGSGKTTFLRRIAFEACEALLGQKRKAGAGLLGPEDRAFPLMIAFGSLAEFIRRKLELKNAATEYPTDPDSTDWLLHYLEAASRERGWGLSGEFFRRKLEDEDAGLLLLDGLDEAPDQLTRKRLARLAELAGERFKKARIVVTSRPPAYGGESVIPGFSKVDIGPLGDGEIRVFLDNWCRLLYPAGRQSATHHLGELLAAIESRQEIREMAVNPVMLTALAVVHHNEKHLPDQRAELYEAVLRWLARRREERVSKVRGDDCLGLMAKLAYAMHTDAAGKRTVVTPYQAAAALAPWFRNVEQEEERLPAAQRFLEEEELHSGIVVRRGDTVLRFWHQTFQEYLASKAVAALGEDKRRKLLIVGQRLYVPEWRETMLLLAGVLHQQGVERLDGLIEDMLNGLTESATLSARAQCVGLIGAMLQHLRVTQYRVADRRYAGNLDQVLAVFDRRRSEGVDLAVRLAAAEAVGQAGDPRLSADNWVRVEGDDFWMGAQATDEKGRNYDPEAYEDEAPVRRIRVSSYLLARYPVTVCDFSRFIEAGGYGNRTCWRAGGFGQTKEPDEWQAQLQHLNRPVTGVSWHEAAAYCAWAKCRLPSEAEWEFAARNGAEATKYPWGNDEPTVEKANYHQAGPGHATPVGLYPAGATSAGIQDMAGNVWEWVADWYRRYPATDSAGPRGQMKGAEKGLRGGAWGLSPGSLRSSNRDGGGPGVRVGGIGFRYARDV